MRAEQEELWAHVIARIRLQQGSVPSLSVGNVSVPPPPKPTVTTGGEDVAACKRRWPPERLEELLLRVPAASLYPNLTRAIGPIFRKWFERFSSCVWSRLVKIADSGVGRTRQLPRVIKEFNEAAPVLARLLEWLEESSLDDGRAVDVVDLCSGFGFLAMFASELAPLGSVECIYLIDRSWPNPSNGSSGLVSTAHIYDSGPWRIPLRTLKIDLGKGGDIRGLARHVLGDARPTLLLGIHLCGVLSLRACQLFNDAVAAGFGVTGLMLAPCCLPTQQHAKRRFIYEVGGYRFGARELRSIEEGQRGVFDSYTQHLLACLASSDKSREVIQIQSWGSHNERGAKTRRSSKEEKDVFLTARAPFRHAGDALDASGFGHPVVVEGDGVPVPQPANL